MITVIFMIKVVIINKQMQYNSNTSNVCGNKNNNNRIYKNTGNNHNDNKSNNNNNNNNDNNNNMHREIRTFSQHIGHFCNTALGIFAAFRDYIFRNTTWF